MSTRRSFRQNRGMSKRPSLIRSLSLGAVALALPLTGCGDDKADDAADSASPATTEAPAFDAFCQAVIAADAAASGAVAACKRSPATTSSAPSRTVRVKVGVALALPC